jgi:hypothetical protein
MMMMMMMMMITVTQALAGMARCAAKLCEFMEHLR